ncbi:hypothetical protein [Vibrio sp. Hal054]|uniref:hypothetical protein n=1 Tax=Vibrio sp. Hal054 TaxID=3035158 RepID=UPI00301BE17B
MHELLPSEQQAYDFVKRIGLERAQRILASICRRFDRRYDKACDSNLVPINREWIRRTELEVELTHRLKIGMTLVDDSNTPEAAHQRILERIEARKARRAGRAIAAQSAHN